MAHHRHAHAAAAGHASAKGQAAQAAIEKASFDPWHALVEHRPLGNVMRARNHAYRLSTQERGAAGEPTTADVS